MGRKGIPAWKYEQVKRFDGNLYSFIECFGIKRDAQRLQKAIKGKGNLARIIKTKKDEVWLRSLGLLPRQEVKGQMKLGLFWIVLGGILLIDGGIRFAWFGWPGLTGVVFAIPLFYWGIKRLQRIKPAGGKG